MVNFLKRCELITSKNGVIPEPYVTGVPGAYLDISAPTHVIFCCGPSTWYVRQCVVTVIDSLSAVTPFSSTVSVMNSCRIKRFSLITSFKFYTRNNGQSLPYHWRLVDVRIAMRRLQALYRNGYAAARNETIGVRFNDQQIASRLYFGEQLKICNVRYKIKRSIRSVDALLQRGDNYLRLLSIPDTIQPWQKGTTGVRRIFRTIFPKSWGKFRCPETKLHSNYPHGYNYNPKQEKRSYFDVHKRFDQHSLELVHPGHQHALLYYPVAFSIVGHRVSQCVVIVRVRRLLVAQLKFEQRTNRQLAESSVQSCAPLPVNWRPHIRAPYSTYNLLDASAIRSVGT